MSHIQMHDVKWPFRLPPRSGIPTERMPVSLPVLSPLTDGFERKISYLRVSLTDRCNYRCTYCMPDDGFEHVERADVLSFEELVRVVRVFAGIGVRRVRLTGGEPTIRKNLPRLVAMLAGVDGIEAVAMTTNGHVLADLAAPLAAAGLTSVNVSVDTVDPVKFAQITRRGDLSRVVAGIDAAVSAGLGLKLNIVGLAGFNDGEVPALCELAWSRGGTPRFIEYMPMSSGSLFAPGTHLSAAAIRSTLESHYGVELEADGGGAATHGPARYWRLAGEPDKRVGIISAMTEHFCDTCNRVRMTAVGDLHTCLAYDDAVSLRQILRDGGGDDDLERAIRAAVGVKRAGHDFQLSGSGAPRKHMIQVGG